MAEDDELREEGGSTEEDDAGLGRVLALSDGVFAIAMTLLALDLRIPDVSNKDLPHALADHAGAYLAFLLSFFVISRYWLNHHRMFRHIVRVDGGTMRLNLLFLLVVAALPFPTAVLSNHGSTTAGVVLYASSVVAATLLLGALWLWAGNHSLTAVTMPRRATYDEASVSFVVAVVFLVSIPVAFVVPSEAAFIWLLLFLPRRTMLLGAQRVRRLFRH
ncbi:MAG TPA: TMEM175 family protein [Mycobacteriales bacterium]